MDEQLEIKEPIASKINSIYQIKDNKIWINATETDSDADKEEVKRRLLALNTAQDGLFIINGDPQIMLCDWLNMMCNIPYIKEFNVVCCRHQSSLPNDDINWWYKFCLEKNVEKSCLMIDVERSTSCSELAMGVVHEELLSAFNNGKSLLFGYNKPE